MSNTKSHLEYGHVVPRLWNLKGRKSELWNCFRVVWGVKSKLKQRNFHLQTIQLDRSYTISHFRTMRGSFIVLEGLDRSGKSSQCEKLVETLEKEGIKTVALRFPGEYNRIQKSCRYDCSEYCIVITFILLL